jgi:serine/threonine protein kinase
LKEYTIGTILNHPCIRKPIDIDIINKCLIYEYIPSKDLYHLLQTQLKTTPMTLKLKLFNQLLDAVEYMHDTGIAHMDIKLENILVDKHSQQIKLIDFGEAFVFHDINHISNVILCKGKRGTLEYMPPEEFSNEFFSPDKADIWACGITLHCILNYTFPWKQAETKYKRYARYLTDNNFILHENICINNILKKFLEPSPKKRDSIKSIKQHFNSLEDLNLPYP